MQVDRAWAQFFYSAGVSFRIIDDQLFKKALRMTQALSQSYCPPNRKRLAAELLHQEYDAQIQFVHNQLAAAQPLGGYTLVTDGLTYQKRPFMNFVAVTSTAGAMVVDIVDCTAHVAEHGAKTAE